MKSRMFSVALGILWVCSAGCAADFADEAKQVFAGEKYKHGIVGCRFIESDTGKEIASVNPETGMVPASCLKILATCSALHYLGPDHKFETVLGVSGTTDSQGILKGNIVIRGGTDCTLGSTRVKTNIDSETLVSKWAEQIKAAGINKIEGDVVVDESYIPTQPLPPWGGDDVGNYYAAYPTGLCFNDNLYYLYFNPGNKVGALTKIVGTEPPFERVTWENQVKAAPAGTGDNAYIYGAPGESRRIVTGTVPVGDTFDIKGALPNPGAVAVRMLKEAMTKQGVELKSVKTESAAASQLFTTISVTQSPRLLDIINRINKQSFNLYAETMLLQVGKAKGDGSRESGFAAEREYFKSLGVEMEGVELVDGSGLSRWNLVTARFMTDLLRALQKEPHFTEWRETLPVMGSDADLSHRNGSSPTKGKIKAKTGYIGGVRGLCGYLECKSGKTLIFAIFANNYSGRMSAVDKDVDALLEKAYEAF